MKNNILITILTVIGLLFGLIGLILSFFPLGTIDIVPATIGLLIGGIAFLITRKTRAKRKFILSVIIISLVAILISLFTEVFVKNEVAEDLKFEEKIEQSQEESFEDLEEALEDIEEINDSIN